MGQALTEQQDIDLHREALAARTQEVKDIIKAHDYHVVPQQLAAYIEEEIYSATHEVRRKYAAQDVVMTDSRYRRLLQVTEAIAKDALTISAANARLAEFENVRASTYARIVAGEQIPMVAFQNCQENSKAFKQYMSVEIDPLITTIQTRLKNLHTYREGLLSDFRAARTESGGFQARFRRVN